MENNNLIKELKTKKNYVDTLNIHNILSITDLLKFYPRAYKDFSNIYKIKDVPENEMCSIKGNVGSVYHRKGRSMLISTATIYDETGNIKVTWFNQYHLRQLIRKGQELVLTGKVVIGPKGGKSMNSPDYENIETNTIHSQRIIPIYYEPEIVGTKKRIKSKWFREKIYTILDNGIVLNDYMPKQILEKFDLININDAIKNIHFPDDNESLMKSIKRLSFDELFFLQLKNGLHRNKWKKSLSEKNIPNLNNAAIDTEQVNDLPFQLTNAQKRVLDEIYTDIKSGDLMLRLMQGDVGSGKTIVAFLVAISFIKEGFQVAIMAPTEILAKQHFYNFLKTFKKNNINVQLITGSFTPKEKKEIKKQISTGSANLIIGTHAIIQDDVLFKNLGIAIIDEQHRFGVNQRQKLTKQGGPHLLNMTATPIPRTLALTLYGDQDLSVIDESPKGRKEIITRYIPENKRKDSEIWIDNQIDKGRQVYIICPLIDDSEVLEVKSATKEYERLKKTVFKERKIGLLHGKLKQAEKDAIMDDFKSNKIEILVSTSVVEVGIDVPNATIIIIEDSERFGLSQLHQFRGRVGRGIHQSYCFVFSQSKSIESRNRLMALVNNSDGFKLSELDLKLRGPGEVYGVKQSGIPNLKLAKLDDIELIEYAKRAAFRIIEIDPTLDSFKELKDEYINFKAKIYNEEF